MTGESLETAQRVTAVLDDLHIQYVIGGSVASSFYGYSRLTQDCDIVADIKRQHVQPMVDRLETEFYIAEQAIRDAIELRSSFNLIHQQTLYKVDIFVPKHRAFDRNQLRRGKSRVLGEDPLRSVILSSVEDTILAKLEWYKLGGGVSNRQWNDVRNMLRVQGARLDRAYMRQMATELDVQDLLVRAEAEVY